MDELNVKERNINIFMSFEIKKERRGNVFELIIEINKTF